MTPFRANIDSLTLADLLQKLPGEASKVEIKDHTITISNYPTPAFSVETVRLIQNSPNEDHKRRVLYDLKKP
jgi:hypothetical protein